jgi:hypothetical protein
MLRDFPIQRLQPAWRATGYANRQFRRRQRAAMALGLILLFASPVAITELPVGFVHASIPPLSVLTSKQTHSATAHVSGMKDLTFAGTF